MNRFMDGTWGVVAWRLRAARDLGALVGTVRFRSLAAAAALHLLVGALPVAFSVGLGLALRELAAGSGREAWWLAEALAAFAAQQVLAPWQAVVGHRVAREVDAAVATRFMRFALTLGAARRRRGPGRGPGAG